jgi:hypothetical protein
MDSDELALGCEDAREAERELRGDLRLLCCLNQGNRPYLNRRFLYGGLQSNAAPVVTTLSYWLYAYWDAGFRRLS